jgi:hypothetical protein
MKAADKIAVTCKVPVPKRPHDPRPTEAKAVAVPRWAPQPNPLTREEIRRLVLEQIG